MDASTTDVRRCSIEKTPIPPPPPFDSLPDEIIEQILRVTDPDGFASLILLNRKWRAVSQRSHLYLHQLALCSSYSTSHPTLPSSDDDNLPQLRRLFAREVKRNLFQAYLRPNETTIKLISTSISSSSCPGGEGMQYSASPRGHHLIAYNSGRVYVVDLQGPSLEIKRQLKILRRPVSACINDKGSLLAVLSTEMQVDLYDLQETPPRRTQSMILDNSPRTIALSPCGSVLAAAYQGGIEVSSLRPDALATDRRAVKCDAVDALTFSFDGTQILGTTINSAPPSTVIITAPYYDPGSHMSDDNLSPLWTTSILFPNTSRDCSHAVLLQDGNEEEASWTFTYDRSFETFRAVRIGDLRNGTTYFTGPVPNASSQTTLLPSTLPAATYRGELVSAGFQGKEVWIYGVPEDLDAVPDSASLSNDGSLSGLGRENSGRSGNSRRPSTRQQETESGRVPQWQLLCDKQRNTLVSGSKVAELAEVKTVKWVAGFGGSSSQERLVVTARGVGAPRLVTEEEDMDFVDGGRVVLLDFDYGLCDGTKSEITIEVGTDNPEVLEEEQRDLATEVAIVRRRTVAQRRGGRGGSSLLRTATVAIAASRNRVDPPLPRTEDTDDNAGEDDDDPLVPRRRGLLPATRPTPTESGDGDEEDVASIDEMEALDAPYAHASPRSQTTLRRAATAAAVDRSINPRTADGRRIEYRRADGRREHPHESDADNWVPPPPPYQKDDPGDLPAFLRGPSVAPLPGSAPPLPGSIPPLPHPPSLPNLQALSSSHPQSLTSGTLGSKAEHQNTDASSQRPQSQGTASDSTAMSRLQVDDTSRPRSSPSSQQAVDDDLYDVTPPDSPQQPVRQLSGTVASEPVARQSSSSSSLVSSIESRADTAPADSVSRVATPPLQTEHSAETSSNSEPPMPALNADGSPVTESTTRANQDTAPRVRRLSNAQTCPGDSHPEGGRRAGSGDAFPFPGSAEQASDDTITALPPLPSSSQLASLSKRVSQGNPRRLSGAHNVPRRPVASSDSDSYFFPPRANAPSSSLTEPEFDQPLIISTPRGVSGAFDPPSRQTSARRNQTPLLAPVPRHPRPVHGSSQRPTVERLETIYSVASSHGGNPPPTAPFPTHQAVPAWLNAPPMTVTKTSPSVSRHPSRAERSAAKNIKDAKKRGWKAKGRKKKAADATSSAGWTDVSAGSAEKEKEKDRKCIVM
ncbi:hypothetical protein FZEAL_4651 [Fusarium zealandicum]|uniref:F-box domain-containing protein n=1 Tax=Fusarium zealandicum TaxID=1053134 RepID=A0A8H4ULB1_9HYPO|nr:hypothetical protein FZEAL_4651 [Fusarium zealandicum]